MAAPKFLNEMLPVTTGNNSSENIALSFAVSANSTMCLVVHQSAASTRNYSARDSSDAYATPWTDGPATYAGSGVGSTQTVFLYREAMAAGSHTVAIRKSANLAVPVKLFELSQCSFDVSSFFAGVAANVDATNGYPCSADTTVIDSTADVALIAAVTLNAAGALTSQASWTLLSGITTTYASQYRLTTTAVVDERGWINESGTNRNFAGVIIAFKAPGGAAPQSFLFRTLMGVGQ